MTTLTLTVSGVPDGVLKIPLEPSLYPAASRTFFAAAGSGPPKESLAVAGLATLLKFGTSSASGSVGGA